MRSALAILTCFIAIGISRSSPQAAPRASSPSFQGRLHKTSDLAIDCSSFGQPCTGTVCVTQTRTVYCDGEEVTCQNDTQQYTGGDVICCTDKTTCVSCYVRGRWSTFYEYSGGESHTCVPNP